MFTNRTTIITIYVDNILFAGPNKQDIQRLKDQFNARFLITDLGPYTYFLGIAINRDRQHRILRLGQKGYIKQFIKKHSI